MTTLQERDAAPAPTDTEISAEYPGPEELAHFAEDVSRIHENIAQVVVAPAETIRLALLGLFAEGHLLLEDLPGVGKTLLAKTIARSIDCGFKRIQFTPDLMPSDITGTSIFDMHSAQFEFMPGPIFSNIVLADEINRTGPRTQAALLEAMAEQQVSVEGTVRHLASPFMVIATQNLAESHGIFPLPDSQMDRFLIAMDMGLPGRDDEAEILHRSQHGMPEVDPVVSGERVCEMQAVCRAVAVALPVRQYMVDVVAATRTAPEVDYGVSPRGGAALQRAAQARAALDGRGYVVPEDVRAVAPNVLAHRLVMSPAAQAAPSQVIGGVLDATAVPA